MCNCRQRIDVKLLERFKAQAPEASNHSADLQGYVYGISASGVVKEKPVMEFKTQALYPLKKGGAKLKTKTSYMHFTYCPFCAEKIEGATP